MKNSINDLKSQLTNGEKISIEKLAEVKGGCSCVSITDPRRCIKL